MDDKQLKENQIPEECLAIQRPVSDALEVLNGKWKLPIIIALSHGPRRFRELSKLAPGISDKMLSKELKELELHDLVTRTIHNTFPPRVEYQITDHGLSLEKVIDSLRDWGLYHRQKAMGNSK